MQICSLLTPCHAKAGLTWLRANGVMNYGMLNNLDKSAVRKNGGIMNLMFWKKKPKPGTTQKMRGGILP